MFCGGHVDCNEERFKIFNISGGAYSELVYVTITTVVSDYQPDIEEKEKLSMIQLSPRFWGMTLFVGI